MSNGSGNARLLDVAQNAASDALQTIYTIQSTLYPPKPKTAAVGNPQTDPSEIQGRLERLLFTLNSMRDELTELRDFVNTL